MYFLENSKCEWMVCVCISHMVGLYHLVMKFIIYVIVPQIDIVKFVAFCGINLILTIVCRIYYLIDWGLS